MPDWRADFAQFHRLVQENYAYWPDAPCDWNRVPAAYASELAAVANRDDFVRLLEKAICELCDHHAALGTNLASSFRLVPTGADLWIEGGRVADVRPDSPAAKKGIRPGQRIGRIGEQPLDAAVAALWPRTVPRDNPVARDYLANILAAGRHDQPRVLELDGRRVELEAADLPDGPPLTARRDGDIGYLLIRNSLGDNGLIAAFDAAMGGFRDTRGLVLDLRQTPSGGNTTVARAILGWFVEKEREYQRHDDPSELKAFGVRRFWTEWVAPRPGKAYRKPVVVLVNRWTGSMGEGIAVAFQGMRRARLAGGPMAGLKGAIFRFTLDSSGIPFFIPTERIFRLDGVPRERCQPDVRIPFDGDDPLPARAATLLRGTRR